MPYVGCGWIHISYICRFSSVGRASRLHRGGREFKSLNLHQSSVSSDHNLADHIYQESKERSWSHSSVWIARVILNHMRGLVSASRSLMVMKLVGDAACRSKVKLQNAIHMPQYPNGRGRALKMLVLLVRIQRAAPYPKWLFLIDFL